MSPSVHRVLVFAEPLVAALVGLLVEIAEHTPVFAAPNERVVDTVERLYPFAVVLLDVTHPAAKSDALFALARRSKFGVAVFGPEANARDIAEIAGARGIPWFTIPPTATQLQRALDLAAGGSPRSRTADRRRRLEAVIAPDGTRILSDRTGTRWMVYDRRAASDRRASSADSVLERVFVSEFGESRRYGMSSDEAARASADALEEQLARAASG